jgi:hypothetical protein
MLADMARKAFSLVLAGRVDPGLLHGLGELIVSPRGVDTQLQGHGDLQALMPVLDRILEHGLTLVCLTMHPLQDSG